MEKSAAIETAPKTLSERKTMVDDAIINAENNLEDLTPKTESNNYETQAKHYANVEQIPTTEVSAPAAPAVQPSRASQGMPDLALESGAANAARNTMGQIDAANTGIDAAYADINKVNSNKEYQDRQQERVAKLRDTENKVADLDFQLNEVANRQINPDAYFENKSTYQRVMANIGLAFGALGASVDGQNRVATSINQAIKDDIAMQQEDKKSSLAAIGMKQNLYKELLAQYKDPTIAYDAAQLVQLQKSQNAIKMYESKVGNAAAKNQANAIWGKLEESKNELKTKIAGAMVQGAGQGKIGVDYNVDELNHLDPKARENVIVIPGQDGKPTYRLALNKEGAKAYNEIARDATSAMSITKDLKNYLTSGSKLSLDDRAKVETSLAALIGKLRIPLTGPGILTEKEYAKLESVIGNPNSFTTLDSTTKSKLLTLDKLLTQSMKDAATLATGSSFTTADDLRNAVREKYNTSSKTKK